MQLCSNLIIIFSDLIEGTAVHVNALAFFQSVYRLGNVLTTAASMHSEQQKFDINIEHSIFLQFCCYHCCGHSPPLFFSNKA